jgi:methylamine dehydrogenase light chain
VTWIGTCHNPGDGRDYIISYNDCCGKSSCNRCTCNRNEGDRPIYQPAKSNDINWCLANTSNAYHCSLAVVIGVGSAG